MNGSLQGGNGSAQRGPDGRGRPVRRWVGATLPWDGSVWVVEAVERHGSAWVAVIVPATAAGQSGARCQFVPLDRVERALAPLIFARDGGLA
jgi:hypothetical protein